MSASERWIFEMKEGLKNKRITQKMNKEKTDICSPPNTKDVGNLRSLGIYKVAQGKAYYIYYIRISVVVGSYKTCFRLGYIVLRWYHIFI